MEPNFDQETLASKAMSASSARAENSVKSRILERIKAQMAQDSFEPENDGSGTSIYLKAPDWPF
jgi:hypothetical protein